jgi:hypothetical protein
MSWIAGHARDQLKDEEDDRAVTDIPPTKPQLTVRKDSQDNRIDDDERDAEGCGDDESGIEC